MELNGFIEKFSSQFDETDISEIKKDTRFKELEEWSSLMSLSIIAMVDDEYEVSLKGDDIRGSNTVEELFNVVKSKK